MVLWCVKAQADEQITLNKYQQTIELRADSLAIADQEKSPVLAGIYGR